MVVWNDNDVIDVKPGYAEGIYGLAVDIGSTTVAVYLCDLRTGEVLATESTMNPQISFGEDLMSRVSYVMLNEDGTDKMHDAIIKTLNKLAAQAAYSVGLRGRDIHEMTVVGNTTMVHLFLGIDPRELGGTPFALAIREAVDIKARELGLKLHPGALRARAAGRSRPCGRGQRGRAHRRGAPPSAGDELDRGRGHQCRDRAGQRGVAAERLQPDRDRPSKGRRSRRACALHRGPSSGCASTGNRLRQLPGHRRGTLVGRMDLRQRCRRL